MADAVVVYKLLPVPFWTLSVGGGLLGWRQFDWVVIGGWKKISLSQAARWVDGKQHLQERLSTALELSKQRETWTKPGGIDVSDDAASHAKEVDPKKLVQFRLPKVARWALVGFGVERGIGVCAGVSQQGLRSEADGAEGDQGSRAAIGGFDEAEFADASAGVGDDAEIDGSGEGIGRSTGAKDFDAERGIEGFGEYAGEVQGADQRDWQGSRR